MGMTVEHDRGHDQLHLIFRKDKLIVDKEWCSMNAVMSLAADGTPLEITVYDYYTNPLWDFDEDFIKRYKLGEYLDDLRLIWENFFAPPKYAVKSISYEGDDGEEIIVSGGINVNP